MYREDGDILMGYIIEPVYGESNTHFIQNMIFKRRVMRNSAYVQTAKIIFPEYGPSGQTVYNKLNTHSGKTVMDLNLI